MPLVDLAVEKWQRWRQSVARGEESRKKVHRQLREEARRNDYQKVAYFLWEADGRPEGNGDRYYLEAQKRLSGIRWRLYKLHQPFISLEKKVIEPLDGWADRANIFQFFSKISPIIEAFGVLAIPFVILAFEVRQEIRQQGFEERIITAQANVRQQQAVREYLSQVTTIHLESDQGKKLREDEELQQLLEANTLALFNELSVREDTRQDSNSDREFDREAIAQDRKGQVVEFLSGLGWINGSEDKEPLLSLSKADLRVADLRGADLRGANLFVADLFGANLRGADL
ncbi:MAG: pentapeptide repeat-containing protein, partial [Cyanobacteria bacterium J06631_2]